MFKPKTLKEAISLARMKDDHLIQQKKTVPMSSTTSSIIKSSLTMKRLCWEEMQKRRTQGLCFNCDEKFTSGHKCKGPQLLVLDGEQENQGEIDGAGELHNIFCNLNLEDKVSLEAKGNDRVCFMS